jgi:hypothetical protein
MTISLPGPSKLGLAGLLSKKRRETDKPSAKSRALNPHEIAQRFSKTVPREAPKPAKLNDAEKQDRARISNLRGALYSDD